MAAATGPTPHLRLPYGADSKERPGRKATPNLVARRRRPYAPCVMTHSATPVGRLEIIRGDITTLAVDAIVNAANSYLHHGGGVALAIARKAGPVLTRQSAEIVARQGPVPTGHAVITDGGQLPARYVIHTVGPIWRDHAPEEADRLLRQCVRSCLDLARQHRLNTIAFPAISTGIYGFPVERAAPLLLKEAAANLSGFARVMFCLFDEPTYRLFMQTARELGLATA